MRYVSRGFQNLTQKSNGRFSYTEKLQVLKLNHYLVQFLHPKNYTFLSEITKFHKLLKC